MKKFCVLILIFCLAVSSYARHDVIYLCQGDTYSWDLSEYCMPGDTLVYASGPNDWTTFYQNAQYDTITDNIISLSPTVDRVYKLISINGSDSMIGDCPVYLTIYIRYAPTISIDSIHHVTCPDGDFYPYTDGAFHVSLDDSVQNYTWIDIENEAAWFWTQAYDSITLTNLRSGTYRIVAHGTNGCIYRDSVVIIQPEAWGWNPTIHRMDTVCFGDTGCVFVDIVGGTPPYSFTWFYYSDTGQVFLPDTTRLLCGLYSRETYFLYMYDSRGCKAFGNEIEAVFWYLYEYVEDSTHIITTDPIACYGHEFIVQAQSIGIGTYTWTIGSVDDSTNYWTSIYGDSMFVADYMTPPLFESTLVSATFYDQHGCETHDSIWVDIYNPEVSMTIETPEIVTDSTFVIHVSPIGGILYLDGMLIVENVPNPYTLSTSGISVGEHTLKYAGTFGTELGLYCDDEVEISFQVQSHPFVTDWDQEISIYPNPATTVLNLSSTEMMDMTISITDITGRVISTERVLDSSHVIDVSNLTSGIYLLHLETPEGASKSIKFVKR